MRERERRETWRNKLRRTNSPILTTDPNKLDISVHQELLITKRRKDGIERNRRRRNGSRKRKATICAIWCPCGSSCEEEST